MANYISKDALLAEIERLENQNYKKCNDFNLGAATYLGALKHFINNLEVIEVNDTYNIKVVYKPLSKDEKEKFDKAGQELLEYIKAHKGE